MKNKKKGELLWTLLSKKMESDAEIKGKAYVHWKTWQEAYLGIVDQGYLDALSLKNVRQTLTDGLKIRLSQRTENK